MKRRLTALLLVLGATLGACNAVPAAATTPQWKLAFSDDYTGSALSSAYATFGAASSPRGPKDRALNIVHDGVLTERVTQVNGVWTGSGFCLCRATTGLYGKYQLRFRYVTPAVGTKVVALLWPADGGWPPEVDFTEFDAANPAHNTLTNHYDSPTSMTHGSYPNVDWTAWHTVALWWTPAALTFRLDGRTVRTLTEHVPHQKMWFGLSNSLGRTVRPDASTPATVDFDVDWFRYYTYQGV